jgi:elongation factor 2
VLFINKVDRLIKELKLSPQEMQARFMKTITEINKLIRQMAPPEFKEEWQVSVNDGSVAFGSAYANWAINVPYMKETGITFKDIIDMTLDGQSRELARKAPIHQIILDMVIDHLPDPDKSQHYRIPQLWKHDLESKTARDMIECNERGNVAMVVTKINVDRHAGEIATGRLFSGMLKVGQEVWLSGTKQKKRIQQLGIYMGPDRESMEEVPAGNIVAITGLKDAVAGETISTGPEPIEPFEAIKHYSEPVVTVAVEPENPKDLPKLIEVLRQVAKEDPTLQAKIDEETGEYLLSGMGELHLEVVEYRIRKDKGVNIKTSEPIVVYRESVNGTSPQVEGKSPNKHNKFYIIVEQMPENVYQAIKEGTIPEGRVKGKEMQEIFKELGFSKDEAKGIEDVYQGNMYLNMTRGVVHIGEVRELIIEAFHSVMDKGIVAGEPTTKLMVKLMDTKLHEDAIHRGPSQVIPAVRQALFAAILSAQPVLEEPLQKLFVTAPQDFMGSVTKLVQSRRGQILDMTQEGELTTVIAKTPVAEMFGFTGDIRGSTEGRALWTTEQLGYEPLPRELQEPIVREIRMRKGMKPEPPKAADYQNPQA